MTSALPCLKCGCTLRPRAKFCDECGSATSGAALTAEYKQVTVLFADVVHSMDIAASVGAERLREIMTALVTHAVTSVRRFGGTVEQFTGDGVMAVFGAPVALEDHAMRACLGALAIQEGVAHLAAEVHRRDGVELLLRVGLNSGQVIVGEIGSAALGYTAIGEQVGMAQRMESVAPPGGVMLSASTARLVEDAAVLGDTQLVHIKGAKEAVPARQLLGVTSNQGRAGSQRTTLVGRESELNSLATVLDRSIAGRGSVLAVVGPPGIGKTRLTRESVLLAEQRNVDVFSTFCESHTSDIAFHAVARLLRSVLRIGNLHDADARVQVRERFRDADPVDVLLLEDLMGIADPEAEASRIDPDARRRRLIALINSVLLGRRDPTVFVVEDVHWIDEASESLIAGFVGVILQTPSLVIITYRPEYRGILAHLAGAETLALVPLSDAEASTLVTELLGPDQSVRQIGELITARAAGNPFFAEEITRELAERAVLIGDRGGYLCLTDVTDVSVPATLQATIAARIDRLGFAAKQTLAAAAVIGLRFDRELLASLEVDPEVDELLAAEFADKVRVAPPAQYEFRHPLIRAVAYESQLKADRARLHRRLAAAIEVRDSDDQNASLIAEHLESAGDFRAAYDWHLRAARRATSRDIVAARRSWERARNIADSLPDEDNDQPALRIGPRTMLCATAYRVQADLADARFDELRQLCSSAGDKASLAIGMAGMVMGHAYQGRMREASSLADEAMALIEGSADATLTVGLSFPAIYAKIECAEWADVLRWSERTIDLADGDPLKGNFIFGSPLALAITSRAIARYSLGHDGWRDDLRQGLDMAHSADPLTYAAVVAWGYFPAISNGVLAADDRAVREIEDALRIAEQSGNDTAVSFARLALGVALMHRATAAERAHAATHLVAVSDEFACHAHNLGDQPIVDAAVARVRAQRGDRDEAIRQLRAVIDRLAREAQLLGWGIPATSFLVETLLDRAEARDIAEAEAAVNRLAAVSAGDNLAVRDIQLLRLRALLASAHDDAATYARLRDRYCDMAKTLDFQGHIGWAAKMP